MDKELLRMQMLAGVITESQYKQELNELPLYENDEAESPNEVPSNIIQTLAKVTKASTEDVKDSFDEKDDSKQPTNEIAGSTLVLIASLLPVVLDGIGIGANWIARNTGKSPKEIKALDKINAMIEKKKKLVNKFDKEKKKLKGEEKEQAIKNEEQQRRIVAQLIHDRDQRFGSDFGQWSKKQAHKLHHAYTWPIRTFLKGWAFFKKDSKLKDKKYRERVANIIYAISMAIYAGVGILSHLGHLHGVAPVSTAIAEGVKEGKSLVDIFKGIALLI